MGREQAEITEDLISETSVFSACHAEALANEGGLPWPAEADKRRLLFDLSYETKVP